jgi:hypothetical protein
LAIDPYPDLIALLDANVLIPAAPRDLLLRLVPFGLYSPLWTSRIRDEVERNLVNAGVTTPEGASRLTQRLRSAFPHALVSDYDFLIDQMTNHPGDRHVVAAAVHAEASVIVTSNLRHFPATALAPHRIRALSIDDFLCELVSRAPEVFSRIVKEQAMSLRRPALSVRDVLYSLALHALRFVDVIRRSLNERP